ncbi:MAG: hypothetical protein WDM91_11095 [Rhizomicrobium sp.]
MSAPHDITSAAVMEADLASMACFARVAEDEGGKLSALIAIDGGANGPAEKSFGIDEYLLNRDPLMPEFVELHLRFLAPFLESLGKAVLVGADFEKAGVVAWSVPRERNGVRVGHENSPSPAVVVTPGDGESGEAVKATSDSSKFGGAA